MISQKESYRAWRFLLKIKLPAPYTLELLLKNGYKWVLDVNISSRFSKQKH